MVKRVLIFVAASAMVYAQIALSFSGAVGDTYRETFELADVSGNAITDATLANFTTSFKRDGAVVSESSSFRNHTTGAYDLVWTPNTAGWYSGTVQYNNTSVVTWRVLVYARDTDDLATTARAATDFTSYSTLAMREFNNLSGIVGNIGAGGTGDTAVTEDSGGDCNLCFLTAGGAGIADATVYAYVAADWDAGLRTDAYVRAWTRTDDAGGFQWPLMLNSGTAYRLVYSKAGYQTVSEEYTP